jgi:hypothetical protein
MRDDGLDGSQAAQPEKKSWRAQISVDGDRWI